MFMVVMYFFLIVDCIDDDILKVIVDLMNYYGDVCSKLCEELVEFIVELKIYLVI